MLDSADAQWTIPPMHRVLISLRHFWDRPYMAVALVVFGFGWLNLWHALAPEYSWRRRLLAVFFWILWPIETLIFFSGRRAREDRDTHIIYSSLIIMLGTLMLIMALFF